MKFIAIHLAMAWIVLQAMPPSVSGGSLRGGLGDELLTSGRRMEEEEEDATQTATITSVLPDDTSENLTLTEKCPTVGKTQIWLGSHKINKNIDHAKLWVISTNRDHHKALKAAGVDWKHVDEASMPYDFGSIDEKCLKFFSIGGAKVDDPSTLNALINNGSDLRKEFDHPKLVKKMNLNKILQFKSDLDAAIKKMNENFAVLDPEDSTKTILKYKLLTHKDWYRRGHGWLEFNGNGLVSGLLDYLELTKPNPEVDWVGWDKSVPRAFFDGSNTYTTMSEMKSEVYSTQTCEDSAEEVWVGYHPVYSKEQDVWIDHAKIWVIKSGEPSDLSRWNDLSPDKIPGGFEGDPNCAKFYTMSSGVDPDEIHGQLNLEDDIEKPFLGAVRAFKGFNVDLSKTIDDGNLNIEKNFALTSLKRTTAFPTEFNGWGIDWNQFNENGYISGLLNYLMFLKGENPEKGQEFKPHGGLLLDGWVKDIPIEFFQKTYSTDKELKEVIFGDHPRSFVSESAAANPQVLTVGEEVEEVSIDPLLAAEEDNLFRAKQL